MAYTLSDQAQFQAISITNGSHKLAAVHYDLMDWMSKQFGVHAIDFFCEKRETSKGLKQQIVHVILETNEDVQRMQKDRASNKVVAERFLKYFKSTERNDAPDLIKANAFPNETDPFPAIIVAYRPFTGVDGKILDEMLNDEQQAILKTYESVWTMSMNVIFYYTIDQVKENDANGTSKKISEELDRAGVKYGLSPGSQYRFDSKEVFDLDYSGKWHYYWK